MNDSLETTHEEAEENITPPYSPNKLSPNDNPELLTSPRYDANVKHIRRKVEGMQWDDRERDPSLASTSEPASLQDSVTLGPATYIGEPGSRIGPAIESQENDKENGDTAEDHRNDIANPPPDSVEGPTGDSDSDDQEKGSKRKIDDRLPSASLDDAPSKKAGLNNDVGKRSRENEDDENPREKKRPTPPPESAAQEGEASADETEPVAPQAKAVSSQVSWTHLIETKGLA